VVSDEFKFIARRWWQEKKHDVIATIIISSMLIGFVIYLIIAAKNGWRIYFN
jgi:hypothetical protein